MKKQLQLLKKILPYVNVCLKYKPLNIIFYLVIAAKKDVIRKDIK